MKGTASCSIAVAPTCDVFRLNVFCFMIDDHGNKLGIEWLIDWFNDRKEKEKVERSKSCWQVKQSAQQKVNNPIKR